MKYIKKLLCGLCICVLVTVQACGSGVEPLYEALPLEMTGEQNELLLELGIIEERN